MRRIGHLFMLLIGLALNLGTVSCFTAQTHYETETTTQVPHSRIPTTTSVSHSRIPITTSVSPNSDPSYPWNPTSGPVDESTLDPTEGPVVDPDSRLFPFGSGDQEVGRYYSHVRQIQIPSFQFYGTRYRHVYISTNGYLTFNRYYNSYRARPLPIFISRKTLAIIAPLWADNDPRDQNSRVYYRQYDLRDTDQSTRDVIDRVNQEIRKADTSVAFSCTWALVVTWYKVPPYYYGSNYKNERNTYQAVLAMDDNAGVSNVIFLYENNGMTWSLPNRRRNWVGISAPGKGTIEVYNAPDAGQPEAFRRSQYIGNSGEMGIWVHKLYREADPDVHEYRCRKWSWEMSNAGITRAIANYWWRLPLCPCTLFQALRDRAFVYLPRRNCVVTWRSYFYSYNAGFQECCYNPRTSLLQTAEDGRAGTVLHYSPLRDYDRYVEHDQKPRDDCCHRSNLCHLFYFYRPASSCLYYRSPAIAWFFGDPHISTLDNYQYTFNGLGEFTLLSTVNFTVQARTALAINPQGGAVKATVFSAMALKDVESDRLHVQMNELRDKLVIYYGDSNISTWFHTSDVMYQTDSVLLRRENATLVAAFPSGFSVSLTLKAGQIDVVVATPRSFRNKTMGLLGVFNGDPDDDLTAPDGTVISTNSTERDIYYNFGLLWRIDPNESLFWYAENDSPSNYRDESFTPSFGPEFHNKTVQENAERACTVNGNIDKTCLYDYAMTGNEELAKNSLDTQKTNSETAAVLANTPPQVSGPTLLNVTVGEEIEIMLYATDADGDIVTLYARETPANSTFSTSGNEAVFKWTPATLSSVNLRFFAVDTTNASSPDHEVNTRLCDCSGHGVCIFNEPADQQPVGAVNFNIVTCNCSVGWEGDHCETDFDACVELPCTPGSNCTDLSPSEEALSGRGYNCTACPGGYTSSQNDNRCEDVDECAASSGSGAQCNQECLNSPGSFTCQCFDGYRLLNTTTCADVDECTEGTASCQHICNNHIGGFKCSCYSGYTLNSDNKTCTGSSGSCNTLNCEHGCHSTSGNLECFCERGYELSADGGCEDIDECTSDTHKCGTHSTCNNVVGGYSCQCDDGYVLSSDDRSCQACDSNHWGPGCQNVCSCPNGVNCDHADGCQGCPEGYTGASCDEDVDECAINPDTRCGANSRCVNDVGSYTCECNDGFIRKADKCEACGNGLWGPGCVNDCSCLAGSACDPSTGCEECEAGWTGGSCDEDVDECSSHHVNASCVALGGTCFNNLGSYVCRCSNSNAAIGDICLPQVVTPTDNPSSTPSVTPPTANPPSPTSGGNSASAILNLLLVFAFSLSFSSISM